MASKDLYEKDLYAILGVKKSDSADAIKKQYRKLARELHPDKTKGDKKLEDRFKSVSEAYEVLSDDAKRADYDQMREAIKSGRIPNGGFHPGAGGFQGNMSQEDLQNRLDEYALQIDLLKMDLKSAREDRDFWKRAYNSIYKSWNDSLPGCKI